MIKYNKDAAQIAQEAGERFGTALRLWEMANEVDEADLLTMQLCQTAYDFGRSVNAYEQS